MRRCSPGWYRTIVRTLAPLLVLASSNAAFAKEPPPAEPKPLIVSPARTRTKPDPEGPALSTPSKPIPVASNPKGERPGEKKSDDGEAPAAPEKATASEPLYRPIAAMAAMGESATPLTPNQWIGSTIRLPDGTTILDSPLPEEPPPPESTDVAVIEEYSDYQRPGFLWDGPYEFVMVPRTLLWTVPLANQREPRMYAKFSNAIDNNTIDTAIGGQFGIARVGPKNRPLEGFQVDGFAVAFTRFDRRRVLMATDFRAGAPWTYAKGPWQLKLAYEHTSSHLGDDYIEATGATKIAYVRDEAVLGVARWFWDEVRVYGQLGYAAHTSDVIGGRRDRWDMGVEWSKRCATDWWGRPFFAYDLEFRHDQNYAANSTLQVGWMWMNANLYALRLAFEYYTGRNPYGQFFHDEEDWIAFNVLYDW